MNTKQSLHPSVGPAAGWAVNRYRHAPVTRVAPRGDVDRDVAPLLGRCLTAAIARRTDVLLVLSRVTLVDGAGVSTILAAHRAATAAGRSVTLFAPRPIVNYVLRVTGVDTVIPIIGGSATDGERFATASGRPGRGTTSSQAAETRRLHTS